MDFEKRDRPDSEHGLSAQERSALLALLSCLWNKSDNYRNAVQQVRVIEGTGQARLLVEDSAQQKLIEDLLHILKSQRTVPGHVQRTDDAQAKHMAVRKNVPRVGQFSLLLIPKRNREHLVGDLEEEYRTIVLPEYGPFWAGCWYFEQVALAVISYAWPTLKKALGLSLILKLIGR